MSKYACRRCAIWKVDVPQCSARSARPPTISGCCSCSLACSTDVRRLERIALTSKFVAVLTCTFAKAVVSVVSTGAAWLCVNHLFALGHQFHAHSVLSVVQDSSHRML